MLLVFFTVCFCSKTVFFSDIVIKVRIAESDDLDFIEVVVPCNTPTAAHRTYAALLQLCCNSLGVNPHHVERIRLVMAYLIYILGNRNMYIYDLICMLIIAYLCILSRPWVSRYFLDSAVNEMIWSLYCVTFH